MIYPRIPHDEKLCSKLKTTEISEIRILFSKGDYNINSLANKFNVSWHTIKRWVDEDYRLYIGKLRAGTSKKNWNTQKGRKKSIDASMKYAKRRYEKEDYRKWHRESDAVIRSGRYTVRKKREKTLSGWRNFWKLVDPPKQYQPAVRAKRKHTFSFWRQFWRRIEHKPYIKQ